MDLHLRGRTALIAASSSGLGFGTATALADEGANVSICGRDRTRLTQAADRLRRQEGQVLAEQVDLTDPTQTQQWVEHTANHFGGLDIVVTNSGGVPFGPVGDFTPAEISQAVSDNLMPHVCLALGALPYLCASGAGRLLMVASESIREPHPESGLSSIARLGVLGLMKGLVPQLGAAQATVNVLAPGYHRTAALDEQFGNDIDAQLEIVARRLPIGQVGQPEDFGAAVAFLASSHARFITGTVLSIDGGNARGIH